MKVRALARTHAAIQSRLVIWDGHYERFDLGWTPATESASRPELKKLKGVERHSDSEGGSPPDPAAAGAEGDPTDSEEELEERMRADGEVERVEAQEWE